MDAEEKNFLGIDWGASAVGVAFADGETRMAFPLPTLQNNRMLVSTLGEIVVGKNVGTIVIGMPSHVNRAEAGHESERLGVLLEKHFLVKVVYQDEMFTTKMAEANLKERGARNIARFDDAEAARIILQEWLDKA